MSKRVVGLVVFAVLLVGGAYYGSPYWTIHQMQGAARAGEGDRLAGFVDFPAVRESVKSQMQAVMMKALQGPEMKSNPFAGLGMMLAGNMVNVVVDGMVTPDNLANMINSGKAKPLAEKNAPPASSTSIPASQSDQSKAPRIQRYYEGLDIFKVDMYEPESDKVLITLVLNREGWFGWKLKSIRLPTMNEL